MLSGCTKIHIKGNIYCKRGFSLVEIVVLMSITAIIAGAGMQIWWSSIEDANFTKMSGDLKRLKDAAHMYKAANSRWPNDILEIDSFVTSSSSSSQSLRLDPWGNPYKYRCLNGAGVEYSQSISSLDPLTHDYSIVILGGGLGKPTEEVVVWENRHP